MIQSKNQGGSNLVFKTAHHIVSQSGFYARDFLSNVLINEVFQPRYTVSWNEFESKVHRLLHHILLK